jgi:membrane protease YdiL (CAAX protease family)
VGGKPAHYALAIAHPVVVMGSLAALAYAAAAIDLGAFNPGKAAANSAIFAFSTFLIAMVTEEGFFRGWLWAAIKRHGGGPVVTLALTTLAFVLWHVSFVFVSGEFHFARADVPPRYSASSGDCFGSRRARSSCRAPVTEYGTA